MPVVFVVCLLYLMGMFLSEQHLSMILMVTLTGKLKSTSCGHVILPSMLIYLLLFCLPFMVIVAHVVLVCSDIPCLCRRQNSDAMLQNSPSHCVVIGRY